jgi:basic amino acid/polyamine antiporter, APA family
MRTLLPSMKIDKQSGFQLLHIISRNAIAPRGASILTETADKALPQQLNMFDAVSTGLAAILGAGIFAVIAPADGIAGPALIISLLIAAFVALCNALSSAQLAAVLPRTGGTYEFGRKMLGDWWGFSAGWMFLVANTVGPGVIALAFGGYLHAVLGVVPARDAAVAATLVMMTVNAAGIRRSVSLTDVIVIFSILSLLAVVVIGLPSVSLSNLQPFAPSGVLGIIRATGLLFFAYTGYSRIATLVEEVRNPRHTIPRATVIALGTATVLYVLVASTAIGVLGTMSLSNSSSPLEEVMIVAGSGLGLAIVAGGALLTTFNEGLSDLLGVSRVAFAMSRGKDLPEDLSHLSSAKNPWRSVLFVGAIAILVAAFAPFVVAVAVSSFGTLLYYTITNLSALKLEKAQRMFPRVLAMAGLVGCVGLAFLLPPEDVAVGLVILLAGILFRGLRVLTNR